jgi:hypothetical protein
VAPSESSTTHRDVLMIARFLGRGVLCAHAEALQAARVLPMM